MLVQGCLDDCDMCEPAVMRAIELDLQRKALENELLKRRIELLDQAQEYRCCPLPQELRATPLRRWLLPGGWTAPRKAALAQTRHLERFPIRWNIAGVGEVVGAFGGGEGVENLAEGAPERLDGAGGGGAEQRLELGESQLDRVQIRAVGRQVEEGCPGGFDRLAYAFDLVRLEVVEHHDLARAQARRQALLDLSQKARR
jgi:hypothetical protein